MTEKDPALKSGTTVCVCVCVRWPCVCVSVFMCDAKEEEEFKCTHLKTGTLLRRDVEKKECFPNLTHTS